MVILKIRMKFINQFEFVFVSFKFPTNCGFALLYTVCVREVEVLSNFLGRLHWLKKLYL